MVAVLLSTKLGEGDLERLASLVQDAAARGDPDLISVLFDAGADIDMANGRQVARRCTWQAPMGG